MEVGGKVRINRALDEVFDFVSDLRNEPSWWRGVKLCERVRGEGNVGTVYRQEARLLGSKVYVWNVEVTAWRRPYLQTIVGTGPLSYTCDYRFSDGTWLHLRAEAEPAPPWSRWGRALKPLLDMVMRQNLRRLGRVLAR
jgi:hypothetical protein